MSSKPGGKMYGRRPRARPAAQRAELEELKKMLPNLQTVLRTAQLELETGDERKALESLHQGLSLLNSYSFHKPASDQETQQLYQPAGPSMPSQIHFAPDVDYQTLHSNQSPELFTGSSTDSTPTTMQTDVPLEPLTDVL